MIPKVAAAANWRIFATIGPIYGNCRGYKATMTTRPTPILTYLLAGGPVMDSEESVLTPGALVAAQGGTLIAATDGGFSAAFPDPAAALVAAQALLQAWPQIAIALHSGPAADPLERELLQGRGAAILAATPPGQILLSGATASALRGRPHLGGTLRDRGSGQLADLLDRESLVQFVPTDGPPANDAPRTLDTLPHNLPRQLSPLIGRAGEVAALVARVQDPATRLLTQTGPGGVGKSRLALAVSAAALPAFPAGAWFVPLAGVPTADLLVPALARALGVAEGPDQPLWEGVVAWAQGPRRLLILDTLEHLPDAGAILARLPAAAPALTVLATSRTALRLSDEYTYPVRPLALPASSTDPQMALESPAVALFVLRAREGQPDITLTAANVGAVVEVATRLDGLPLALELAAARARGVSPQALAARLAVHEAGQALPLLSGGAGYLPARQQTLRAAIGWSVDLLPPEQQAIFARLGVFAGGADLPALQAVAGLADSADLDVLLDQNLIAVKPGVDGAPRYGMLRTIQEYAAERLAALPAVAAETHAAHRAYYRDLAETAAAQWIGPQQADWLRRLEEEHDNLRAAIREALAADDPDTALRLGAALWRFWLTRGYFSEGRYWLAAMLVAGAALPAERRTVALNGLGNLAWSQGDYAAARGYHESNLVLRRAVGNGRDIGITLNNLAIIAMSEQDYEQAETLLTEALALAEAAGEAAMTAICLNNLGRNARYRHDFTRAHDYYSRSLALRRQVADSGGMAFCFYNLGEVALLVGNLRAAGSNYRMGLEHVRTRGDRNLTALYLEGIAGLLAATGAAPASARLFGAAAALRQATGTPLHAAERVEYERQVAAAQAKLDPPTWDHAWAAGRVLSPDAALDEAAAALDTLPV
jgi:predicted ATPase